MIVLRKTKDAAVEADAALLRQFRMVLCLSQTEMARLLRIDRAHLSRIETGQREVTDKLMLRFHSLRIVAAKAVEGIGQ